jgi:DNA-binding transcriptional ArsR family regulator
MVRPVSQNWTGQDMNNRIPFGARPGHDGHDGHDGNGHDRRDGNGSARGKMLSIPAPVPTATKNGAPAPDNGAAPAAPTTGDDASVCRLLALLADKTRLKILRLLAEKELHVGALTAALGLPQPTVSHHLAWLRTVSLVSPRRAGKFVYYALGPAAEVGPDGQLSLHAADQTVTIARRK